MGLGRDHPGLEHGRTHRPRRGFLPDQGGCRIGEHWNALGVYDHLPRGHRATANPAWRPAHLPDAPRPLDTPSWHRVLPGAAVKAPDGRPGTVPRLDDARASALLFIRPPAQRSCKERKGAFSKAEAMVLIH